MSLPNSAETYKQNRSRRGLLLLITTFLGLKHALCVAATKRQEASTAEQTPTYRTSQKIDDTNSSVRVTLRNNGKKHAGMPADLQNLQHLVQMLPIRWPVVPDRKVHWGDQVSQVHVCGEHIVLLGPSQILQWYTHMCPSLYPVLPIDLDDVTTATSLLVSLQVPASWKRHKIAASDDKAQNGTRRPSGKTAPGRAASGVMEEIAQVKAMTRNLRLAQQEISAKHNVLAVHTSPSRCSVQYGRVSMQAMRRCCARTFCTMRACWGRMLPAELALPKGRGL